MKQTQDDNIIAYAQLLPSGQKKFRLQITT